MDEQEQEELHTLDYALDLSIRNAARAIDKNGEPFLRVHVFVYQKQPYFVMWRLVKVADGYQNSDDAMGRYDDLYLWLAKQMGKKTREAGVNVAGRSMWQAEYDHEKMMERRGIILEFKPKASEEEE